MGVAPVGLGDAAWTHPLDAQLPQAMTAIAFSAASRRPSSAVLPAIVQ